MTRPSASATTMPLTRLGGAEGVGNVRTACEENRTAVVADPQLVETGVRVVAGTHLRPAVPKRFGHLCGVVEGGQLNVGYTGYAAARDEYAPPTQEPDISYRGCTSVSGN